MNKLLLQQPIHFALLLAIYLALYLVNGAPILNSDSVRYHPHSPMMPSGSALPIILNYPLYYVFSEPGIAMTGSLLQGFGLSCLLTHFYRSFRKIFYRHEWDRRPILTTLFVGVFSFSPLYAIAILSEPYCIAAFAVTITIILSRRITALRAVVVVMCAAAHASAVPVLLITVVAGFLILKKRPIRLLVCVSALIVSSYCLDALIAPHYRQPERLGAAFAGSAILNHLPYVLDELCEKNKDFKLCASVYQRHIRTYAVPNFYYVSQFLWGRSSLMRYPESFAFRSNAHGGEGIVRFGVSALPENARLTISEMNQISKKLVWHWLLSLPHHMPENAYVFIKRMMALISRPISEELTRWAHPAIRHIEPMVDDPAMYINSTCGTGDCQSIFLRLLAIYITNAQYISLVFLTVVLTTIRAPSSRYILRVILWFLFVHAFSVFLMANVSMAAPRYHYRTFFMVSLPLVLVFFYLFDYLLDSFRKYRS